jgi:pimeloyl-ACP methyl ester carboxylesterase
MIIDQTPVAYQKEAIVEANGLEIAYDSFGSQEDPPLLLVGGLGMSLTGWDPDFCQLLAEQGFWVIRFDNRDVGHSSKLDQFGAPGILSLLKMIVNQPPDAAYTLTDMAADAVRLLDVLSIEAAHVVGMSMGGMIAQTMAINHPERLLTLTSIMSSTNDPSLPLPHWRAMVALL